MANSADKIRQLLTQQQENIQIPQFLNTLKAKANIQIYDQALQGAIPTPIPAPNVSTAPAIVPTAAKPAATSAAAPTPPASKK